MPRQIRFGSFIQAVSYQQRQISYNDLTPEIQYDESGRELAYQPTKLKLRPIDTYRLIQPYVSMRFIDQVKAVIPLAVYLVVFQLLILRQEVVDSLIIGSGLLAVILGLMLFMEGLKQGLMPLGETLGVGLPSIYATRCAACCVFTRCRRNFCRAGYRCVETGRENCRCE